MKKILCSVLCTTTLVLTSFSALADDATSNSATAPAAPVHQSETGGTAKGAAIGGLGGAVVGHPMAGAVVGGVIGHHRRHKANKQAKKDAKEAAKAQSSGG